MTVEQRELYCYTTSTQSFSNRLEELNIDMAWQIVKAAIKQYEKDYGTSEIEIFSDADFTVVSNAIIEEHWKRGINHD